MYYTLGQRKGLGIGGQKNGSGEAFFVCEKDLKNNVLYVTQGEQDILFSDGLVSGVVNWIPKKPESNDFDCYAKFRYRQPEQKVRVHINEDGTTYVTFYEKQRAVTPGQFVVFYDEQYCLGGGVIEQVIKEK
jgi:tRNA-specific 2-thiouridylase